MRNCALINRAKLCSNRRIVWPVPNLPPTTRAGRRQRSVRFPRIPCTVDSAFFTALRRIFWLNHHWLYYLVTGAIRCMYWTYCNGRGWLFTVHRFNRTAVIFVLTGGQCWRRPVMAVLCNYPITVFRVCASYEPMRRVKMSFGDCHGHGFYIRATPPLTVIR